MYPHQSNKQYFPSETHHYDTPSTSHGPPSIPAVQFTLPPYPRDQFTTSGIQDPRTSLATNVNNLSLNGASPQQSQLMYFPPPPKREYSSPVSSTQKRPPLLPARKSSSWMTNLKDKWQATQSLPSSRINTAPRLDPEAIPVAQNTPNVPLGSYQQQLPTSPILNTNSPQHYAAISTPLSNSTFAAENARLWAPPLSHSSPAIGSDGYRIGAARDTESSVPFMNFQENQTQAYNTQPLNSDYPSTSQSMSTGIQPPPSTTATTQYYPSPPTLSQSDLLGSHARMPNIVHPTPASLDAPNTPGTPLSQLENPSKPSGVSPWISHLRTAAKSPGGKLAKEAAMAAFPLLGGVNDAYERQKAIKSQKQAEIEHQRVLNEARDAQEQTRAEQQRLNEQLHQQTEALQDLQQRLEQFTPENNAENRTTPVDQTLQRLEAQSRAQRQRQDELFQRIQEDLQPVDMLLKKLETTSPNSPQFREILAELKRVSKPDPNALAEIKELRKSDTVFVNELKKASHPAQALSKLTDGEVRSETPMVPGSEARRDEQASNNNISGALSLPPPAPEFYSTTPDSQHQQPSPRVTIDDLPGATRSFQNQGPLPNHVKTPGRAGNTGQFLSQCPTAPDVVTFAAFWYQPRGIHEFLVCTKCYDEKLLNTVFAGHFERVFLDKLGYKRSCLFGSKRSEVLLKHAVQTNDSGALQQYMRYRVTLKPCPGRQGAKHDPERKWFTLSNGEVPGFMACEACYQDLVLSTGFGGMLSQVPGLHPAATCDLATRYISRSLWNAWCSNSWTTFVSAAKHRRSLPPCPGDKAGAIAGRRWYGVQVIPTMTSCEGCYLDHAGAMPQASSFRELSPTGQWATCEFAWLPFLISAEALLKDDFGRWVQMAAYIASQPNCSSPPGEQSTKWYTLLDPATGRPVDNFDLCAACYTAFGPCVDMEHLYTPSPVRSDDPRRIICDFSTHQPRRQKLLLKYVETIFHHDPAPFIAFVARYSALPLCGMYRTRQNAHWYGTDDFLICPSCYEEVVRDTVFASAFPYQNTLFPTAHHCVLYSSRMRTKYLTACHTGDLGEFAAIARHREAVYQQTVPAMESILAMTKMRANQAKFTGKMGTLYTQMDAMAGIGSSYVYTNGVHTYNSPWGATAGAYNAQSVNLSQPDINGLFRIRELEALWKEVE